jgi:hypothetical protein
MPKASLLQETPVTSNIYKLLMEAAKSEPTTPVSEPGIKQTKTRNRFADVVLDTQKLGEKERALVRAFAVFAGLPAEEEKSGEPSDLDLHSLEVPIEEKEQKEKEEDQGKRAALNDLIEQLGRAYPGNNIKDLFRAVQSNQIDRVKDALALFPDKNDISEACKKMVKILMDQGDMMHGVQGEHRQKILHLLLAAAYGEVLGVPSAFGEEPNMLPKKKLQFAENFLKEVRGSSMALLLRKTATLPSQSENPYLQSDAQYPLVSYLDALFPLPAAKDERAAAKAEKGKVCYFGRVTKAELVRSALLLEAAKAGKGNVHYFGSLLDRYRDGVLSNAELERHIKKIPHKQEKKETLERHNAQKARKAKILMDVLFQPVKIKLTTILRQQKTYGYFLTLECDGQGDADQLFASYCKKHLAYLITLREELTQEVCQSMGNTVLDTTKLMKITGFIAAFADLIGICGGNAPLEEKENAYKKALDAADEIPGLARNRRFKIIGVLGLVSLALVIIAGFVLFEPHMVKAVLGSMDFLQDIYASAGKSFAYLTSAVGGIFAALALCFLRSNYFQHTPAAITTDFFKAQKTLQIGKASMKERAGEILEGVLEAAGFGMQK